MIKKIMLILTLLFVFGITFTGISFLLDDEEWNTTDSVISDKIQLDEFHDIKIKVIAADIKIRIGDTFSIAYQLHPKEQVKQNKILDGKLYFTTKIDTRFKNTFRAHKEKYFIDITLPEQAALNDLTISTVDGHIEIENRAIQHASFKSVAGDISLTNVVGKQVNCDVVSGEIDVKNSNINDVIAEGKSSNLSFNGSFETADLSTVSGNCNLISDRIKNIKIKNISGDIDVTTPISGVSAKSYGKINYCGEEQGFRFNLPNDKAMLTLKSTSGRINIQNRNDN